MRAKILVVDDEPDILRSTYMLLNRLGYECVVLPDATVIDEVVAKEKPQLILQDLLMPGVKVAEVMKTLRKNAASAKIPVVLFSASPDLATQAAELDAAGVLPKPFGEAQLVSVISQLIGPPPILARVKGGRTVSTGAPAATGESKVREEARVAVTDYFHDYWNTLTALNNYAQFLLTSQNLDPAEKEAAQEMSRLLLELERKTDALRGNLLEYVQ